MRPYGSKTAGNGWCADGGAAPGASVDIDGPLAGAGYRVRSSELRHVAQRLERLESAMGTAGAGASAGFIGSAAQLDQHLLASDAVHYNPSDLAAWVDSMLSEISPTPTLSSASTSAAVATVAPSPCHAEEIVVAPPPIFDTMWNPPGQYTQPFPQQQTHVSAAAQMMEEEEDSGIRLVHLLMKCAESVQNDESALAGALIEEMQPVLARVGTRFGIGKVAGYFIDALGRRLYAQPHAAVESEVLYHHFYEACPYLKFAHFTANQAILEAFDGCNRIHVVDFNLMHGLQWPALIQALALRPGGPPSLRLTGIGPPSPDGRDSLREVGMRLAELARSVGVRFAFRGVAAARLDDVRPWMLHVVPGEALAVNSVMQLHRLLGDPDDAAMPAHSPIDSVLEWIRGLRPRIVMVVEQEADHNKSAFLDRFTGALFYYSTVFDSLEGRGGGAAAGEMALAEAYLQMEICNIVCCEGKARVERHEPLARWRGRMGGAGFRPTHLGSNAFRQASMLLTLFSGEGYCVEEVDGCLTLGWHSRPLISASAWTASAAAAADVSEDDNSTVALPLPAPPFAAISNYNGLSSNVNHRQNNNNNSSSNRNNSSTGGSSSSNSTISSSNNNNHTNHGCSNHQIGRIS